MEIRRAALEDIEVLAEFMRRTGYNRKESERRASRIGSHISSDRKLILVLEDDSRLLGYVGIKKKEDNDRAGQFVDLSSFADLMWVGVDPDFRHRSFGSRLVQACDEIAKNWGKAGIWLNCKGKRILFYTSNGYRTKGAYFDENNISRYIMVKDFE